MLALGLAVCCLTLRITVHGRRLNGTTVVQQPVELATLTARYTAAALAFVRSHAPTAVDDDDDNGDARKNFALYYAFDHVHTPQFGSCASSDSSCTPSPRGPFGDALLQVDAAVGEVLSAIRALNDAHAHAGAGAGEGGGGGGAGAGGTFAFLTSDNGAPSEGQVIAGLNAPFTVCMSPSVAREMEGTRVKPERNLVKPAATG